MITKEQKSQLDYYDTALKNMLTDKQKLKIEYDDKNKATKLIRAKINGYKVINKMKPHDYWINWNTVIDEEREIAFWFDNYIKNERV